jgi:nitrate/TMAO reductase-like tetraheme cytochrome c subunit
LSPIVHLSNNWISLTGVVLVTTSAILWLFLIPASFGGTSDNPYLNILTVMLLPAAFFGGLLLIPIGQFLLYRRERRDGTLPGPAPSINLGNPDVRRLLLFLLITTAVNLVIGAQLSYKAVHHMESVSFCGTTCHTVMQPEYTAYQNSPHSRVACVECHIGPGASWAVRSKIDGVRQVIAVMLDSYSRPIPTPVHTLRPARETCEECHWPQKFASNRLRIIDHFADDEQNARTKTVLLMRLGGGISGPSAYSGIHGAHLGPGITIRYAHSDEQRQQIPWISMENSATGRKTEYRAADAKGDLPSNLPVRVMDCMDCHNRPSHAFELPERALDHALSQGRLDPAIPFIKKRSLELLKAEYGSQEEAAQKIKAALPGKPGEAVFDIWSRNVFPEMQVKWGTYPNNIGHTDFPGCFRCHDDSHASIADSSKTITQDCNACHHLLAMEEESPKVLTDLGIEEAPAAGAVTAASR